ncbi:MAG TPA: trigger factor [Alkalispirochaeta sp.]|nr:trigger factor [Alkalispirochaeta sp.]
MVQDKKIEKLENSAVKLTVTIPVDEVQSKYDELVKKYSKDAQIKGFRKGKVPRNILERKFGDAFRAETLQDLLESGIGEAIEDIDEKPLPYARPTLVDEDLELDPSAELTFSVTYDVFPEVELGEYTGLELTEPQVKITKKDEDRDIEELRQQNALVIDKEDGTVATGDLVTMNYEEVDENDDPVDGTRREDFEFTVGEGHNLYHIDTEVVGMQADEPKVIEKEFPEDFEHEELAGEKKRIRVTVTRIRQRDLPDLDDEFAQDISDEFESLDDLRKDVRSKLEKNAKDRVRRQKIDQLMTQVVEGSTVAVPATMVDTELDQSWQNLAQQYRVTSEQLDQLLQMQGKTRDEIFEEWRPAAVERITRSLLVQKMIENEEIEVSEEDAEEEIRADAAERSADPDQIIEYYKSQGMLNYVQQEVAERRMFDKVLDESKVKKGEKIAYVDLLGEND